MHSEAMSAINSQLLMDGYGRGTGQRMGTKECAIWRDERKDRRRVVRMRMRMRISPTLVSSAFLFTSKYKDGDLVQVARCNCMI